MKGRGVYERDFPTVCPPTIPDFSLFTMRIQNVLLRSAVLSLLVLFTGCESSSNTMKGAGVGAGAGAVIGGIIGSNSDNTAKGVLIGSAIGGAAGAIIGAQMDKQAEELDQELENATVERVGEGIQITFDSAILFSVDSSELSTGARRSLADLAASLQSYPNTNVLIVGHTDDTGAAEYNQSLSERRASAAAAALADFGIPRTRLSINGFGETQPIADNATPSGRQQNRRVEVAIFASDEYRQSLEQQGGGR